MLEVHYGRSRMESLWKQEFAQSLCKLWYHRIGDDWTDVQHVDLEILVSKKDFDAAVDHAAIPHIMKAKHAPPTGRICRLLFGLSQFTFHLYYVKGKGMI